MRRMWINQPSSHDRYHEYHGQKVLVDFDDRESPMVYFLSGDTLAMQMDNFALSRGWPNNASITHKSATPASRPYRVSGEYIVGPTTSREGIYGGTVPVTWATNLNVAYEAGQKSLASLLRQALTLLRPLDCGLRACHYCEAVSPSWKHTPQCAYHNNIKAINNLTIKIDNALREITQ